MKFEFPEGVKNILKKLNDSGFEAYVVGGAIRDMLIDLNPKDYDIATNALPEQVVQTFDHGDYVVSDIDAKSYHIVVVNGIEIATYRKDVYENGVLIKTEPVKTIKEDASRRDFTVNSMNVGLTGVLLDFHYGEEDLKNRTIKFVGNGINRIREDPNRIIRAARMAAKINGTVHNESLDYIKMMVADGWIKKIASERIRLEILKAMECENPSQFFRNLQEFNCLQDIFPTLNLTSNISGGKQHRENVFDHNMFCGDYLRENFSAQCRRNPMLLLSAYLHDIGKAYPTFKDGEIHFYGHEDLGAEHLENELNALKFTKKEVAFARNLTKLHMQGGKTMNPKSTRKLLYKLHQAGLTYQDWLYLRFADRAANLAKEPYNEKEMQSLHRKFQKELHPEKDDGRAAVLDIRDLAISGTTIQELLNIGPSQVVGAILQYLLDRTIKDPTLNTKEKLCELIIGKHPKKPVCPIHKTEMECKSCRYVIIEEK